VSPTDNCPGDDDALEKRVLATLGRANGLHPLAERLVPALLRIDMPLRLAELARVPEENRDGFLLAVFAAVIDACLMTRRQFVEFVQRQTGIPLTY